MKARFLLPFLIGIFTSGLPFLAKSQHTETKVIKLNGHFAINGAETMPYFSEASNDLLAFRWPALSLRFQYKNGKYDEIELTNLVLQRAPDFETDTRSSIGLRYERGRRIGKHEHSRMGLRVGFSARAYYGLEQLTEANPIGLPVQNDIYGMALALNPHFEYRIFKHLVFDFSPYCDLINFAVRSEYVYDEAIEEEQRQSLDFNWGAMRSFFRFGLGWEF